MIRQTITALLVACTLAAPATAREYTVNQNAHAHNDYMNPHPFHAAHSLGFASIEVDVILRDDQLYVAHEPAAILPARTFARLYLLPLLEQIDLNGGAPYPDGGSLQLLVDLKTDADATLRRLERELAPHRHHFDPAANPNAVRVIITGNVPAPEHFDDYDAIFFFDGNPRVEYTSSQSARVPLVSLPAFYFTRWNGLGRMPERERRAMTAVVDSLHRAGKKVRFWGAADTKTLWQAYIKMGVDYINTDRPAALAAFLDHREQRLYAPTAPAAALPYAPLPPTPRQKPKNVILLISDGAGLAHLWAAATANGGALNVTTIENTGFLVTAPADDYNTDSAAAGTALATGHKTRNRYIGVDTVGRPLANLTETLSARGIACGIITNDNLTGATPAAFYAHRRERDESDSIARDLLASPLVLAVGGRPRVFTAANAPDSARGEALRAGFLLANSIADLQRAPSDARVICLDRDDAARDFRLIESAFAPCLRRLSSSPSGFFLMVEGAKIDAGGHSNNLALCIDEYLSFDRVVGEALRFADVDGETLVIVTSDHETGGLVPLDGNYSAGTMLGHFATTDHTGIPVPLFAHGPGASFFRGFFQNSDLFSRVTRCLFPVP
ncbi:MAG: alkaline phosphatase [Odoribacteraceae bacterium]|jgi:alkaline phosphatase|nr:alkaline phosphatase [Odoribacteraceae bacterium]